MPSFYLKLKFRESSGKNNEIPVIPINNTKNVYEEMINESQEVQKKYGMNGDFIFKHVSNYMEGAILEYLHSLGTPGIVYYFYIL